MTGHRWLGAVIPGLFFLCGPAFAEGGTWPPIGQLAGGVPCAVAVEGDCAYVAAYGALTVVDISDPAQPRQVGYWDTPGDAQGVAVAGAYAYVADGSAGLRVIDISDPASPVEVGHAYMANARGVAVAGGYAYVANDYYGLRIVDVSNPAAPVERGSCGVQYRALSVAVSGGYAYVAWSYSGLRAIDISNPAAPVEVGYWDPGGEVTCVAVAGEHAYVGHNHVSGGVLRAIDISNPAVPVEVGFSLAPSYVASVAVAGGHAYVADGSAGLRVNDISNPAAPVEVGYWDTPGDARGVAAAGGFGYVADGSGGLRVIDISDSAVPVEVGCCKTPGSACDLVVAGEFTYVADGSAGLAAIDVSDPATPVEVGYWAPSGEVTCVAVAGAYAYVGDSVLLGDQGLRMIDVSNPAAPAEVGFCDTPSSAQGVAVAGGHSHVANGYDGLRIVDVSNPAAPAEVGFCDTPGSAAAVAVAGSYAYVADGNAGLRVIIVADPSAPSEVGFWDTQGYARAVAVAGMYAYVADEKAGLRVIDISNPATPVEVAYWDTPGDAWGVAVAGGYVYLADNGWGLVVFPEYSGGFNTDLVISSVSVTPPTHPASQELTEFSITVTNNGSSTVVGCMVDIYSDRSTQPSTDQRGDGRVWIASLEPGGSTTVTARLVVGGGSRQAWARVDAEDTVVESDEENNDFGPVSYEVPGLARPATAYWDFGLTAAIGGDLSLLAARFGGLGLSGVDIGAEAEGERGLRFELLHPGAEDEIRATRSGALGLTFTGDLGSIDLGAVKMGWETILAGGKGMCAQTYRFPDPYHDDSQAGVLSLVCLSDLIELASRTGTAVSPVNSAIVAGLAEWATQAYAQDFREKGRWEAEAAGAIGTGTVEWDSGPRMLKGLLQQSAGAAGVALRLYGERWEEPELMLNGWSEKAQEGGFVVAPRIALSPTFIYGEAQPGTLEAGQMWAHDPDNPDSLTEVGRYLANETELEAKVHKPGVEVEFRLDWKERIEAPMGTVADIIPHVPNTPWEAIEAGEAIRLDPLACLADLLTIRQQVMSYSEDMGDVPIAWWQRTEKLGRGLRVGVTIPVSAALGIGGGITVGISGSAMSGIESVVACGEVRNGELVPTMTYTQTPPTYQDEPGFVALASNIIPRGLAHAASYISRLFGVASATVQAGTQTEIDAVDVAGEGLTQVLADGAAFGQSVQVEINSYSAGLGTALFGAEAAAKGHDVPYRSYLATSPQAAVGASPGPVLTLVGRVHVVTVSDTDGTDLSSIPPGGIALAVTVLPEQLERNGFRQADEAMVRLYHYREDDIAWEEIPASESLNANGSVSLAAALAVPGQYAPGIVALPPTDSRPALVVSWPADRQLCAASPVEIGLIVTDPDGIDVPSIELSVDGAPAAGVEVELSTYATYVRASALVTLDPGSHRLSVEVEDILGHRASRETMFYVERSNTFPDVPEGHWAWLCVEAAKLAGIVRGYPDGTYHPEYAVTRDQMAVYIARALADGDAYIPDPGCTTPVFTDVLCDHWARKYIQYTVSQGVVQGYPEGDYKPGLEVTRDQMAVYVARSIATPTGEAGLADYVPSDPRNFPDVPSDFWAYKQVEYCVGEGVVNGYDDGYYHPEIVVTRDQMAVYIARAFGLL